MLHVKMLAIRGSYTFQATQSKSEESEMNIYTTNKKTKKKSVRGFIGLQV